MLGSDGLETHGRNRRIYIVGPAGAVPEDLRRRLAASDSVPPVEVLEPAALPAGLDADRIAGVVCLDTPSSSDPDHGHEPGADDGSQAGTDTLVERIADAGGDCPVVVVGPDVDGAAAYEAGATDIVPLDAAAHADTVAERLRAIVDRRAAGQFTVDLIDETGDGIVVHDPETGEILACNERFYTMLGYDPATDDIELSDITGHDDEFTRSRAVSLIREAARGQPTSFEWQDPTNEGESVWVEVKLEAAELDGETYVVASVRDVSERKANRQKLRDSRDVLERLHGITGDPDRDLDERIDAVLELGAEWFGMDIGCFVRIDDASGTFEVVRAHGDHPLIHPGAEHTLAETYCRRTVDTESPVAIRDTTAETADDPASDTFGLGSYFGTAVVVDGEQYGALCFADEQPRTDRFSGFERTLLDHMASWLRGELEQQSRLEEVEATRGQLTRTLQRVDDAFFSLGEDWRVGYVNDAGAEVLRAAMGIEDPDAEVVGRHLWEEVPDAVGTTFYEEYHAAMRDQESRAFEEYYAPLDVWFQVRAYPDEDGLSVYFTDVTERKERERELYVRQRVLEEASLPLTLADPEAEGDPLVFANEAFEDLTGYDREAALGRNCRFLQGPETDPETVAEIRAAIEAEETITTDIRNYRADGTPFWNRLDITPIYDEDGTLLRFLGSQRDVTAERRGRQVRQELLSTTETLMSADSRQEIADSVADAAVSILGHEVTAVYLDTEAGLTAAAWSDRVGDASDPPPSPDADSAVRAAIERGEPVTRTNLDDAGDGVSFGDATVASVLAVPLGETGALVIGAASPDGFGTEEITRAELLTINATAALERADRRQELERYETLFETVQDKLYVVDADGYIEMISDPLADAVGYDAEALEGEHVSTIMTEETVADGKALVLDLLVTPDAVSDTFEGSLRHRDGEIVPVEIEFSVLPHDEAFRGTVGAVRDISERQQREAELRVLREAIAEAGIGLAMYDETGHFEYVNDHCAQLLGRTRAAAEVVPVWESLTTVTENGFDSYWASFTPGETRAVETEVRRADGTSVPVETVTTAVEIDGIEHHLLTIQNVTDRRQRRQQSEVLHRIIRHNLRNDLTVVLGHARYLAEQLDGSAADSARTIESTANGLRDLSETVRDAADLLGQETTRRPVDVAAMLRQELSDFRDREDVRVEATLPESQSVLADTPLRTALKHLLVNAVEHNDAETATVMVDVSPAADRQGWVTIEIADDGPGIPADETAVLTAGEETPLEHGSGIGLWIVHWLITRYGGELRFRERSGGGSVVGIDLPAADTDDGDGG